MGVCKLLDSKYKTYGMCATEAFSDAKAFVEAHFESEKNKRLTQHGQLLEDASRRLQEQFGVSN